MGYRERYNHRRKMGYSPEKARRMSKGGCYIATAVYGSYDCPQVWTLQRFCTFSKVVWKNFYSLVLHIKPNNC